MCRAMKRSDAERKRSDAERKRLFRGKGRGKAVKSARRWTPCVPRVPVSLRPVNVRGYRAKGMRAPENTNQFLMTEKYRLHALRSDSVDSGSEASSDTELTDMDSYLGAWENAHGALLDPESAEHAPKHAPGHAQERAPAHSVLLWDMDEDSAQYFPSEDDLNLSDNFMHRDFAEFCRKVTA
ncbi:hypothetical protein NL108_015973 [Boleophthalmus pectinirostris]|uniref:coiled-coil domain-containing glutamate-rich protein 1 n=1 Tax=Boleophthalmus pectinirostris TaxID=150288 RepID=UPI000A1C47F1|nr:coiled-coil domain-containing glutamate-rich protein 1 [Boleophthalmus pectinirostris]KAJ0050299.1 hypothetical protein NL108_015973 [Boleophthalmus pectinirostris]